MSNMGNDYYLQNFYDLNSYKKSIDKNQLPIFRGMKLSDDDKIRQHATQQVRSYFRLNYQNFKEQFNIDFEKYFEKEIKFLDEMIKDGLVLKNEKEIIVTDIGQDFVQNIMNIFDKYDPPSKTYSDRLATIKKAKEAQSIVQKNI